MKKSIVSALLAMLFCLQLGMPVFAKEGCANFTKQNSYAGEFTDVTASDWFETYVKQGYEYGLIKGSSESMFSPEGQLTIAQTITLAVRLYSIYTDGQEWEVPEAFAGEWYMPYVNYALEEGIIAASYEEYNVPALRHEVAEIFAKAVPAEALSQNREVSDNVIPDVSMEDGFAPAVYTLYRAGVLSGSDEVGTFYPYSNIKRSEIAAICVRMADPSMRSDIDLRLAETTAEVEDVALSAEEIAEQCSPAMVYIKTFSLNGEPRRTGCGFFVSADGVIATNYDVIANSIYTLVYTQDGQLFGNVYMIDYDEEEQVALLKVMGSDCPYLEMGDSDAIKQGQSVYTLGGSPNSDIEIEESMIANPSRDWEGIDCIQTSLSVDYSNDGAPLLDATGKVVGVLTANTFDLEGKHFAVLPSSRVKALDQESMYAYIGWREDCYFGFEQAIEFGYFSSVDLLDCQLTTLKYELVYDLSDFCEIPTRGVDCTYEEALFYYNNLIQAMGLTQISGIENGEGVFESEVEKLEVVVDEDEGVIRITAERFAQYYEEYKALPDFGWYTHLSLEEQSNKAEGMTEFKYIWENNVATEDEMTLIGMYVALLTEQGFTFVDGDEYTLQYAKDDMEVFLHLTDEGVTVRVESK